MSAVFAQLTSADPFFSEAGIDNEVINSSGADGDEKRSLQEPKCPPSLAPAVPDLLRLPIPSCSHTLALQSWSITKNAPQTACSASN